MDDAVLAIDDEPAFLEIIRKVAKSANIPATVTTDSAVFRTSLTAQIPSVVFLDLQMPGCDGVELLHVLADANCRAKVWLMSGFDARVLSMAHAIGRDLGLDMGTPLQKPLRPADLRTLLAGLRGKTFDADALKQALDDGQLELVYQPVVTLSTRATVGFEALVRWRHPEYGIVMPDRFIDLAEKEGLINRLTDYVLELAVMQACAWQKPGIETFVSVNVSAGNIMAEFPDRLTSICADHSMAPSLLRLELTETAAMGNHALMLEVLTRMRLKGIRLAIDDFGTGYSSLVQLHRLPFSELKIDRSFIAGLGTSEEAEIIVGAIVNLGHSLKLELIAEGIETEEQMKCVMAMGCQSGQGYLFSRPMASSQVPDWLSTHPAHRAA
jgi:EAL domain-containing protein (putative c-di-GMP-specific phosphodiesterase class I)/ActR/RegA family two-component response regulator